MKMRRYALLFSCLAALPVMAKPAIHWSYEGQGSPEHWAELGDAFQTCKTGQYQSPVDITQVIDGKLPPLGMNFHTDTKTIVNNGHTIQVTVKDSDDFQLDNDAFVLKQFHFHAPSENHLFGKSFPLEAHFVHANQQGELAVLAVMFETGAENSALKPLLASLPAQQNQVDTMKQSMDLATLFPVEKHYYRFSGSLTTPPCTEGVRWLILKQPVTLSPAQLAVFEHALEHANNRPLQPLHGRIIVE
ncbi:carbonic anhydrase family protein [Erwinia sp. 198]|nr:carbonic anhydrase family protein [Erwinia sp. 198]RRZ96734.1 carbonic anhydrase family protein [Erwinia sp. 198]